MSYLDDLRRGLLQSKLRTNDENGYRTHLKVFVGTLGESDVTKLSDNLQPHVKTEVLMTVEDDHGNLHDIQGRFIILSVGKKAAKIVWDDNEYCYIHFHINQCPAHARFFYGSIVRMYSPDVPMSDVMLGLLFKPPEDVVESDKEEKPKRPTLTVVKGDKP